MDEKFLILWDVNLKIGQWKVQMDGLLLTEKCAVVIESKNISNEIHYDHPTEEFCRKNPEGEKTVMENPVIQTRKNIRFLSKWFALHKIMLPVDGLIVFTANNCEFYSKPPGAYICKAYQMNEYLYEILQKYPLENASHKLTKIKKMIMAEQTPYERTPLCKYYKIEAEELKKGVYCLFCKLPSMKRYKQNWSCASCGHRDRFAHHLLLQEYFSLINTQLTNQQFREFGQIESPAVARRLLMQYDLDFSGDFKSRIYQLKSLE